MKKVHFPALGILALASILGACSHKTDVRTELEKTATALAQDEKTQPAPAPPAPDPQTAAAVENPLPAEPAAVPAATPAQQMQQALASYKTGQLEDAVTRLQKLRAMPTLTAQQRMAVQDSVAAVMNEVYEMAAKGDSRAIAAVAQYEKMQTAPRR
ncbi:MAG TPA: hypothetical protein VJA21_14690 [Verrucomicrobiae bacterium]